MSYCTPWPIGRTDAMEWRNRLVVRLSDDGLTYRAIAKWFGLSPFRVAQIDIRYRREVAARGRRAKLIADFNRCAQ